MGEEGETENMRQKVENKRKHKSKKEKKNEDSNMEIPKTLNTNGSLVVENVPRSEIEDNDEMKKHHKKDKKKKNDNGKKDIEADMVKNGASKVNASDIPCEDGSADAVNNAKRKKKKRKLEIGSSEEVGANEGREKMEEESVHEIKKKRKKSEDGDFEKKGEQEHVKEGEKSEANTTEEIEKKKRKRDKKKSKDDDILAGNSTVDNQNKSEKIVDEPSNEPAEKSERKKKKTKKNKSNNTISPTQDSIDNEANTEADKPKNEKKKKPKKSTEIENIVDEPNDESAEKSERNKKKMETNQTDEPRSLTQDSIDNEANTEAEKPKKEKKKKLKKSTEIENIVDEPHDDESAEKSERKKKKTKNNKTNDTTSPTQDSINNNEATESENPKKKEKKKKTKKSTENLPSDPTSTPSKSNKKVRFSEENEIFPLPPSDPNTTETDEPPNLIHGKRFTEEENELIKQAVHNYILDHDLGEEGLNMVLNCKKHKELRGCWREIGEALPHRPYTAVYYRAQVLFRRSDSRKWTQEEYDMILQYQELHGNEWKALADELGKHRWHVKDTYRRIKLLNRNKGNWSQKEYQNLFDLVNVDLQEKLSEEKKSKHGMLRDNICWSAISDKLSTRIPANCCTKWYKQLTSPMVAEGVWADTDDYRLVGTLYELDAHCVEDVDWDDLMEHRTGDLCLKRWKQMVMHIGHHGIKTFGEQVDALAKRYCPHLLEAREIWDNKPRVD